MSRLFRLAFASAAFSLVSAIPPAEGLRIFFIDVDGGAATLVVTPERESILIDTGWPGFDDRDPNRIVHALKDVAGLDHIDHLVITHWHVDHFGGVEGLAKLVEIKNFWDRGLPEDDPSNKDFPDGPKADDPLGIAYRKASAGKRKALKPGDTLPLKGAIQAVVVTASGAVYQQDKPTNAPTNSACESAPPDQAVDGSDNARSVSILFRLGTFEFLACGDLTWNIEKKLICDVDRIKLTAPSGSQATAVDVFQVTHHGSDSSNNPALIRTIEPTVAVMNNGPRKGGAAATVRTMKSQPSIQAFYALHKNVATPPADNADPALTANGSSSSGTFVQVQVAPDAGAYDVRIGENGEPRTFKTR